MGALKAWLELKIPTIGITGGKGGTGKTTVATNLTEIFTRQGKKILLVDFDVDAPNTGVLLGTKLQKKYEVKRFLPKIIKEKCTHCGACSKACREHAILAVKDNPPIIFPEICSGCGACKIACKPEAIADDEKVFGYILEASPSPNLDMIAGELKISEARSAIIVEEVKQRVIEKSKSNKYDLIIVDTAPGAHCDVLRALYGVRCVLCVTEPTPFGSHDLERILQLLSILNTAEHVFIVLNRADLTDSASLIEKISSEQGIELIASIPNDIKVLESHAAGKCLMHHDENSKAAIELKALAEKLEACL
ncbi:MAG: nucleotide-binding protein [Candidatus Helarchaeales archaeon]